MLSADFVGGLADLPNELLQVRILVHRWALEELARAKSLIASVHPDHLDGVVDILLHQTERN